LEVIAQELGLGLYDASPRARNGVLLDYTLIQKDDTVIT